MRVTISGSSRRPPARQAPDSALPPFNDALGHLHKTNWRVSDLLHPPGLGLRAEGVEQAAADSVYEATLLGDATAVARVLGVPPPLPSAGGPTSEEAEPEQAEAAAAAAPAAGWRIADAYGVEPLGHAAAAGHAAVVEVLLSAGADTEAKGKDQLTALMKAARGGHGAAVEALVAKGAVADCELYDGTTALQMAAMGGHAAAARALIAGGSDLAHVDAQGVTPLMAAAQGGSTEVLEAMLEAGARINATDENGWGALHFAATDGHQAAASLLAERGAAIDASTRGGRTLADMNGAIAEQLVAEKLARDEAKEQQAVAEEEES